MKTGGATRPYRMKARAESTARTVERVLAATVALWRERSLDEITLPLVAERAGVSVHTVLRRFGSKDDLLAACIERDTSGIGADRERTAVGDVAGTLAGLLAHYESDGDAVVRTLALEGRLPAADALLAHGREAHRHWCARVFAPFLPTPSHPDHPVRLDALVAATDLYVWKLLRRDLGRSADETARALATLVDGVLRPRE